MTSSTHPDPSASWEKVSTKRRTIQKNKPSPLIALTSQPPLSHPSPSTSRRIPIPPHRFTPLRDHWVDLIQPLVTHLQLQVRMNIKRRCVEIRLAPDVTDQIVLHKGCEFLKAFLLGFDLQDAQAILRLEHLYVESFDILDVKKLSGDHLARCIGRLAGHQGKTKFAIENASKTRIVLADHKIHLLGAYENIKIARNAICSLILGTPPGKVYNRLRLIAKRIQENL